MKGFGPRILASQYLIRTLRLKSENMAMWPLSKISRRVLMLKSGELGNVMFSRHEQHYQLKIVQSASIVLISSRILPMTGFLLLIPLIS